MNNNEEGKFEMLLKKIKGKITDEDKFEKEGKKCETIFTDIYACLLKCQ